jgi:hypothetical protein
MRPASKREDNSMIDPRHAYAVALLKAISDASTHRLREKPFTRWLRGEASVRTHRPPDNGFDKYQWHGQLHWRNRLCSLSQSRPAKEPTEAE